MKSKELVFAVDVDDTLRATVKEMVSLYNETFPSKDGDEKTELDVKSYNVDESFPMIKENLGISGFEFFFLENGERIFSNASVLKDAKEALKKLREIGKVIIVTYQKTTKNRQRTLAWLKKYDLQYDGICFLKDKSLIKCDYFIDDYHENFVGSNSKHGVLIDRPYNRNADLKSILAKSNCKDIKRVSSLYEFVEKLTDNKNVNKC